MKKFRLFKYVLIVIFILLLACERTHKEVPSSILFDEITEVENYNKTMNLTNIFGNSKIIIFDNHNECKIEGRKSVILKRQKHFYVKSFNEILIFDSDGKYMKKLSRCGMGPEEYEEISDFDVLPEQGEIWIASKSVINKYDINNLKFKDQIDFGFFVNNFKVFNKQRLIVRTPDEETYKICNDKGGVIDTYLKKDLANSMTHSIEFFVLGNKIIAQLETSNNAACYSVDSKKFDMVQLTNDTIGMQTAEINRKYFDKYGYFDQPKKVREDYRSLFAIRNHGKEVIMVIQNPGNKWDLVTFDGVKSKKYRYFPKDESVITNDLSKVTDLRFLNSLHRTDSDDSFIFIMDNKENESSNPMLLEVSSIAKNNI